MQIRARREEWSPGRAGTGGSPPGGGGNKGLRNMKHFFVLQINRSLAPGRLIVRLLSSSVGVVVDHRQLEMCQTVTDCWDD